MFEDPIHTTNIKPKTTPNYLNAFQYIEYRVQLRSLTISDISVSEGLVRLATIFPPPPPVVAETLWFTYPGTQRIFFEPVAVFEGETVTFRLPVKHEIHVPRSDGSLQLSHTKESVRPLSPRTAGRRLSKSPLTEPPKLANFKQMPWFRTTLACYL